MRLENYDKWLDILKSISILHQHKMKNISTGIIVKYGPFDRFSVLRILRTLDKMKVISKMPSGYKRRHWRFTKLFPDNFYDLVEQYETYKLIKRNFSRRNRDEQR